MTTLETVEDYFTHHNQESRQLEKPWLKSTERPTQGEHYGLNCVPVVIRSVSKKAVTTTILNAGPVKQVFAINVERKLRGQWQCTLQLPAHAHSILMTKRIFKTHLHVHNFRVNFSRNEICIKLCPLLGHAQLKLGR